MVDFFTSFKGGKNPSLLANYTIRDDEPVFSGGGADGRWPSVYVIEGLGQSCNLLIVLSAMEKELIKSGLKFNSLDEILTRLPDDEPDEIIRNVKSTLVQRQTETYSSVGFLGSADMEITGHARQGQVISYEVQQNQAFGSLFHSTVRAYADENLIARGTMVSAARK